MKKRLYSIAFMFALTFFFAAVVSAVKAYNEERIQTNQQVKLQRIILKVLGVPVDEKAPKQDVVRAFQERVKSIDVESRTLYVGYSQDGRSITGYAFPVGGSGFWGPVYGMVSVDPEASKILGLGNICQKKERAQPVIGPYKARIGKLLAESKKLDRKQRYTAHRIYEFVFA